MASEAGAPTSPSTKLPAPLTQAEQGWTAVLVILGAMLTVGVLIWFGLSTDDGGLKSKVTTVTEPAGQTTSGTKTTTTTDYADTIVIFALTAGAALVLAGAFYGRLRELKLGALTLGVGELAPDKQQQLDQQVASQVSSQVDDPQKREVATAAAKALARETLKRQYWGVVPSPPPETISQAAEHAATRAVQALQS